MVKDENWDHFAEMIFATPQARDVIRKAIVESGGLAHTDSTTAGGYLVPDELADYVIEEITKKDFLRQIFPVFNMGSDVAYIPSYTAANTAFHIPENLSEATVQSYAASWTFSRVTLTAHKIACVTAYSYEVSEDAKADIARMVANDIVIKMSNGEEDAIINGDTSYATGTNVKAMWNGLFKSVSTSSPDNHKECASALLTMALMNEGMELVEAQCDQVTDIVVSSKAAARMRDPTEFEALVTRDKIRNPAIETGLVGELYGANVIRSRWIADSSSNTSDVLFLNRDLTGVIGDRRGLMIERDKNIFAQANWVVATRRFGFGVKWTKCLAELDTVKTFE